MKCKFCKNEIPAGSIFCNWCGERQIKERKRKDQIKVPRPRQLPSGNWNIQLREEGQSITEPTKDLCIAKAKAIRAGFLDAKKILPKMTVGKAIDNLLEAKSDVISPSTLRGYYTIRNNRFQSVMDCDIADKINWQSEINKEAALVSPKTLKSSWALVSAAISAQGVEIPDVQLPQVPKANTAWLDYKQILIFCDAVKGKPCELAALLALHSLRRSEIMAITGKQIDLVHETITVSGSVVFGSDNKLIRKSTNKNKSSQRIIPFLIPRIRDLLLDCGNGPLFSCNPNTLWAQINRVCVDANLPLVGVHGLRRSFASLAYHLGWSERETMLIGGWSDYKTMHDLYIKIASADKTKAVKSMNRFYKNTNNIANAK